MSFTRTVSMSFPLNEASGWSSLGSQSLNFAFSLSRIVGVQGGTFTYAIPIANVTEFTTLFDYYKIGNIKMTMFFTNNMSSVNTPGTGLPILLVCNDYDDATNVESIATMYQRAGTRTFQFTADHPNGISHYCKPNASSYVLAQDGAGIVTQQSAGIAPSTWINTGNPDVIHNAIKVFYNNQGVAGATTIGNVTFVFEIELQFKGYR